MRLVHALTLSAALALALSGPGAAQEAKPPTIVVTGTGSVEAAPDMATLSIGVTTQGDSAAAALAANSAAVEAVMARLTAAGIEARDMQTSNLSLYPNWHSSDNTAPTITSYVASNQLTIRIRQLDGLGAVLDAAVADGANTLNGLTFGLADPGPALDEARKEAVAEARARAELLAAAAGVTLGPILQISEGGSWSEPAPMYRAEVAAAPVPVAGGELGLSATVTIHFEIAR